MATAANGAQQLDVAERLRNWRTEKGLTQMEFASLIGAHVGMVRKYESASQAPGTRVLMALAQAGIDVHWLITGETAASKDQSTDQSPLQSHRANREPWPHIIEQIEGIEDAERRRIARQQLALRARELAEMSALQTAVDDLRNRAE